MAERRWGMAKTVRARLHPTIGTCVGLHPLLRGQPFYRCYSHAWAATCASLAGPESPFCQLHVRTTSWRWLRSEEASTAAPRSSASSERPRFGHRKTKHAPDGPGRPMEAFNPLLGRPFGGGDQKLWADPNTPSSLLLRFITVLVARPSWNIEAHTPEESTILSWNQ